MLERLRPFGAGLAEHSMQREKDWDHGLVEQQEHSGVLVVVAVMVRDR
jgi:hypothetical protein